MNYSVTYRDGGGRQLVASFRAANRDELFRMLEEKGIHAVSVSEGGGPPKGSPPGRTRRPLLCAVTAACLVAAVAVFLLMRDSRDGSDAAAAHIRHRRIADAKPTPAARPVAAESPAGVVAAPGKAPASIEKVDLFNGVPVVQRSAVTNNDGTVVERIHTSDGKSHRVTTPPKRVFDNASDQLIAMAISGAGSGVGMPPLPLSESVEADFRKSLEKPIEILDSDSDDVKLMKLDVMAVREELRELVSQGKTVREALSEHQTQVNRIAAYHQEALKMIREVRERDGAEAANEFLKTINEKLKAEGSPAIPSQAERTKGQKP